MADREELTAAINAKGDEIRNVKTEKSSTMKEDLESLVKELLALKVQYKEAFGEEFGGAKPDEKKKKGPAPEQQKKSDGPSKAELNKLKRKEAKAKAKEEARTVSGADSAAAGEAGKTGAASASAADDDEIALAHLFGDAPLVCSKEMTDKAYMNIDSLTDLYVGQKVWVRARVSTSRAVGKGVFLLLRQQVHTVQAIVWTKAGAVPKAMVKFATSIPLESIVDIQAKVTVPNAPIASATVKGLELVVSEIHIISRADDLPFQVEDASRSAAEAAATGLPVVNQDTSLNFRWVDTRTPANQAIFRIQSGVCQLFREFLLQRQFVEIHTPKLIGGASEGGANVFTFQYFNSPACLAQSPQLYKQMAAACGGFERVFEIGPVFRAENANTHRCALSYPLTCTNAQLRKLRKLRS